MKLSQMFLTLDTERIDGGLKGADRDQVTGRHFDKTVLIEKDPNIIKEFGPPPNIFCPEHPCCIFNRGVKENGNIEATAYRVDRWIKQRYPGLSKRLIRQALEARMVLQANGAPLKKGEKITEMGQLNFKPLEAQLSRLRQGASDIRIPIIDENEHYCVIDKPSGIPSHPLHLNDSHTVTHWAFFHYPAVRDRFCEAQPTLTPHRLDTETSGVLIVSKTPENFFHWRELFHHHQIEKVYLAWCWGRPNASHYEIDTPIGHHSSDPRRMICLESRTKFRKPVLKAHSQIEILDRKGPLFLAKISCKTGVTHQVRVHLSSLGFPILGDTLYDNTLRLFKLSHFQLRAIELRTPDLIFRASDEPFCHGIYQ